MKKQLSFIFIFLCFLLSLAACQSNETPASEPAEPPIETIQPEPAAPQEPEQDSELPQREKDWMEDIEFLRTEYKKRHLDPFYLCTEEEFDWKLDQLAGRVAELSDNDITFEIMAIIAGMGDVHTYVQQYAPLYDRRFPVRAEYFGGKLYLTACLEGFEQFAPYLLQEIVAVNGVHIGYLNKKAESIIAPFNSWAGRETFDTMYFLPAFFDWAGCNYKKSYTFQILNENGEMESIEVPDTSNVEREGKEWIYPENWEQLIYKRDENWVKYIDGANGGCVCMSFKNPRTYVSSIERLVNDTAYHLAANPECHKMVIDLREHPGGSHQCMGVFAKGIEQLKAEQVYVLTGGTTGSSAMLYMAYFKDALDAVTVGEPAGQFSSFFYGKIEPSILPHSQIGVQIADLWWNPAEELARWGAQPIADEYYNENGRLYPWENTILPDVYIYQDIEDIRQGKDSVLEWVLAQ